jgi:hypothetical protein
VWLTGDPPLGFETPFAIDPLNGPGDQSDPSATLDASRFVFAGDGDVWETTGAPPLGYRTPSRIGVAARGDRSDVDPALSPDGRVLVWVATPPGGSADLFVARRRNLDGPFGTVSTLSRFNTADAELDPYIAPNGDLLFTRRTGGVYGVYLARAVFP